MSEKKYIVEVLEAVGTCDSKLFRKMAEKGDITATKLSNLLGAIVKITGYATCHIETDDKAFDMNYFDAQEYGFISSGSEIFAESVKDYYGEVEYVRLTEVKTKKGKTYKAVPVLTKKEESTEQKEEPINNEDLQF